MDKVIHSVSAVSGMLEVPGDKSISHRAAMIGALANGKTQIEGFLNGEDCLSTIRVFRQLGIDIEQNGETSYLVHGKGYQLKEPTEILDVGNSGTTIRLLSGILAGQSFQSIITGDNSIIKRPMIRVKEPLKQMGAHIDGRENGRYAPLAIRGGELKGITYNSPIASAQVKSAVLLAGLFAYGKTTVIEPYLSRDHSERILKQFGVDLAITSNSITIQPTANLQGQHVKVPTDFSSAAFFIAAALLVPNSSLRLNNVGINPTRIGFLEAVKQMNGNVEIDNIRQFGQEPVGDLIVKTSQLQGITIEGEMIPKIIDELPLLAVIASQAEGKTIVKDAEELRVKETDRIATIASELNKVGVKIEEYRDGFAIDGRQKIKGGTVSTHGDHRIGMAMSIAGLISDSSIKIQHAEAIGISYPTFYEDLKSITK